MHLDVRKPVASLNVAERQMVEIAKAMTHEPSLLILDEPTAALDERESERLFTQVRRLRDAGVSVIYISHRMDEVFDLADRIVVLRDGRVTLDEAVEHLETRQVVTAMVGEGVEEFYPKERNATDQVVLETSGAAGPDFHDIDLQVRAGEVLGIGGVVGCGRGPLLRALFGLQPMTGGSVRIDGSVGYQRRYAKAQVSGFFWVQLRHIQRSRGRVASPDQRPSVDA